MLRCYVLGCICQTRVNAQHGNSQKRIDFVQHEASRTTRRLFASQHADAFVVNAPRFCRVSTRVMKFSESISNGISTYQYQSIFRSIYSSALTPVDEVKQIGSLINGFILRVNFGRDFEKQLQFYDEARGSFTNIDSVLVQLVQVNQNLTITVKSIREIHTYPVLFAYFSAFAALEWKFAPLLVGTIRREPKGFFPRALLMASSRRLRSRIHTRSSSSTCSLGKWPMRISVLVKVHENTCEPCRRSRIILLTVSILIEFQEMLV